MKQHGLDAVSLVFGAVFLSLVVAWLGTRLIDIRLPSAGWLVAAGLVVFGILGVVLTLLPSTNTSRRSS
jgi:hypothetical protein